MEEGWKLYRGGRLEEREQAAMQHLVPPAEATTPALGKEGRKITSELYLHQRGGRERGGLETRSTVNMEQQDLIFLKRSKKTCTSISSFQLWKGTMSFSSAIILNQIIVVVVLFFFLTFYLKNKKITKLIQ